MILPILVGLAATAMVSFVIMSIVNLLKEDSHPKKKTLSGKDIPEAPKPSETDEKKKPTKSKEEIDATLNKLKDRLNQKKYPDFEIVKEFKTERNERN